MAQLNAVFLPYLLQLRTYEVHHPWLYLSYGRCSHDRSNLKWLRFCLVPTVHVTFAIRPMGKLSLQSVVSTFWEIGWARLHLTPLLHHVLS